MRKESPAHRPLTLTTSNGIFRSKYSGVAPMRMPWPFKGGRPAAVMAVSRTFTNFERVRGVKPVLERYANRGTAAGGSFTWK